MGGAKLLFMWEVLGNNFNDVKVPKENLPGKEGREAKIGAVAKQKGLLQLLHFLNGQKRCQKNIVLLKNEA